MRLPFVCARGCRKRLGKKCVSLVKGGVFSDNQWSSVIISVFRNSGNVEMNPRQVYLYHSLISAHQPILDMTMKIRQSTFGAKNALIKNVLVLLKEEFSFFCVPSESHCGTWAQNRLKLASRDYLRAILASELRIVRNRHPEFIWEPFWHQSLE